MFNPESTFRHLDHVVDGSDQVFKALAGLRKIDLFPSCRAALYKNGPFPGIRTALWIELGHGHCALPQFLEFKGLWLFELHSLKVTFHGSRQYRSPSSIGGQVIHSVDVLDCRAPWLPELAEMLAFGLFQRLRETGFEGHAEIRSALASLETNLLRSAIGSFASELDGETIGLMETEGTGRNDVYNYYVSADYERHRNRVQAARCFPSFSRTFRTDWLLKQAIDNGKPLLSELTSRYQVQPRTIKYFREVNLLSPQDLSRAGLIKSMDNYTPEYFPTTLQDFEAFASVSDTLNDLASTFQVPHLQLARPFVSGWQFGIKNLEASLGRKLKLELIFDMAQASFYYGVKPALQQAGMSIGQLTHPPINFFHLWFGQYGLKRLLKMAYSWERIYSHFSLERLGIKGSDMADWILDWPQLLPSSYCHGPYRVVELTSQHELETEGRKLDHCVASYGIKCLVSGSFIYSIRDRLGNHLSTFEIQFDRGVPLVRQHKAMHNIEPEANEQAIVKRFVTRVLNDVSLDRLNEIYRQRYDIQLRIKGLLDNPDSYEPALSEEENDRLSSMVEFTHPSTALVSGIAEYLMCRRIFR